MAVVISYHDDDNDDGDDHDDDGDDGTKIKRGLEHMFFNAEISGIFWLKELHADSSVSLHESAIFPQRESFQTWMMDFTGSPIYCTWH